MTGYTASSRLSNFPNIFPGEHIYSGLARYHILSGNRTSADTRTYLGLPQGTLKAQNLFNGPGNTVLPNVAEALDRDASEMARHHTLEPLFRLCMPQSLSEAREAAWRHGRPPVAKKVSSVVAQYLRHDRSWRYCVPCSEEDVREYGVAYWHIEHQIPGLGSCPHHKRPLRGNCKACGSSRSTLNDFELPSALCKCPDENEQSKHPAWDQWLYKTFIKLRDDKQATLETTLQRIRSVWNLPDRITGKYRPRIDALLAETESALGIEMLEDLFEYYASADGLFRGRTRPNFIWATMTNSDYRLRHPLYFLVLLYAQEIGVRVNKPSS